MATVADHVIATLRVSGIRGCTACRATRSTASPTRCARRHDVGARAPRGGRRVRGGRGAALTGELAVCAGSCGPGNLHLINGLFDAQSQPGAGAGDRRADPAAPRSAAATSRRPTRRSCSASAASTARWSAPRSRCRASCEIAMRAAVERARGRGGRRPRRDLPARPTTSGVAARRSSRDRVGGPARRRGAAARRRDPQRRAERSRSSPAPACEGAHDAADRARRRRCKAPIVHALRGKEFIEYDNPFDVGMTGLLGFASGYRAMKEAATPC